MSEFLQHLVNMLILGRHLCAARDRPDLDLWHYAGREFHPRRALCVRSLLASTSWPHAARVEFLSRAAGRDRRPAACLARLIEFVAAAPDAGRRHRHDDADHDRRVDRACRIPSSYGSGAAWRSRSRRRFQNSRWSSVRSRCRGCGCSCLLSRRSLIAAAYFLINRTKLGKAMRATFQDRDTASLMGVNISRIYTSTFAIGSSLAAAAGALLGPVYVISPQMGDLAVAQGVCDRHPWRPGQHHGRDDRRVHSRIRGRNGRGIRFVRLPRRDGLSDHHRRSCSFKPTDFSPGRSGWDEAAASSSDPLPLSLRSRYGSKDPYLLNALITTGIFIDRGDEPQSVARLHRPAQPWSRRRSSASALMPARWCRSDSMSDCSAAFAMVHEPWPVVAGFVMAIVVVGLVRLSRRQAVLPRARRIFRHRHISASPKSYGWWR